MTMIQPGQHVGHYEVTGPLGAGGMGEVWRATDSKLGREVALKVLPEEFASDPDRFARFEREAKVLASLNHPNIAHLYGLESLPGTETGDLTFLVMELVEGEDLSERIARGPIPVDEAIPIALQIAEALEAAHEQGIVHRDLKPANIKLAEDGTVKVLDFGLAKAWEEEGGDSSLSLSPTLTRHATVEGVILGTAAYMSPEQARGKKVDRRADIWAFGVVLWEMLTGRKLFEGETLTDVLAAVLRKTPTFESLPPDLPPSVHRVVTRCLERDPHQRLQWIGDARLELEATPEASTPKPASAARSRWLGWGVAAAIAVAGSLGWIMSRSGGPSEAPLHFEITDAGFSSFSSSAISPDGHRVAFFSTDEDGVFRLQIRSFDGFDAEETPETVDGENPFFSPDGEWIVIFDPDRRALKKVSVTSKTIQTVPGIEVSGYYNSGAWHPDGYLILSGAVVDGDQWHGLVTIPASGGEPEILTTPQGLERRHYLPEPLPDSPWVLFTHQTEDGHFVSAVSTDTGETKLVLEGATTPQYVAPGYLLAFRPDHSDIVMAPFDPKSAVLLEQPIPVVAQVGGVTRGTGQYAVADDGTLIYNEPLPQGASFFVGDIVLVDRTGRVTELEDDPTPWTQPRFSGDGTRLLLRRIQTPNCELWTRDLDRGTTTRITFEHDTHNPLWHPNGDEVMYSGDQGARRAIFRSSADGSEPPVFMMESDVSLHPASWTSDGGRLALGASSPQTGEDVWVFDLGVGTDPFPFLDSRFGERHPIFSPDGRWIAYASDESGQWEVFVRPYPGGAGKTQISSDGGSEPLWSPDGTELYFRANGKLMVADISSIDNRLRASTPRELFDDPFERATGANPDARNYDLSPDGSQFAMIRSDPDATDQRPLRIVTNWLQSVRTEVDAR